MDPRNSEKRPRRARRSYILGALLTALGAALFVSGATPPPSDFDPGKAPFVVLFGDEVVPYRIFGMPVMPGETYEISAVAADDRRFVLRASAGIPERRGENRWHWTAPKTPGHYEVEIVHPVSTEAIKLNTFVMVPLAETEGGAVNGYRVGSYPAEPLRGLSVYEPPDGLIEVTPWNRDVRVSPHFTLGQFLCKQADGYPKYVVLDERLPRKLETILEKLNENGVNADGFHVMSGFRTPFYNLAIGNVKYSIHQWGGAADIYVDEYPKDGVMDDLNRDGRVNKEDALFLYQFVDDLQEQAWFKPMLGGLGAYESTSAHGPFVHVDVRGFLAHWGGA